MDISELRERIREREEDYVMPVYLPYLPAILGIISIPIIVISAVLGFDNIGFFASGMVFVAILGIAGAIIGLFVLYKWIDRRNGHFKRVQLLYENLLDFLSGKGSEEDIRRARRSLREMESESDKKNPVLWIILAIVFWPIWFYIFHFLTKDFFDHQKRENFVFEDIGKAIESAGGEFSFRGYDTIENRNTILYIVLTIITLGLFGLYWIYVITKDPNKHFKESARVESRLLESLESI